MEEVTRKRSNEDYAGLMPTKGWPRRNLKYLRYRVVPQIFKKITGTPKHPVLEPPAKGKARVTWIGHASFFVQFEEHSVLFDPNWATWLGAVKRLQRPGILLDHLPDVDLVLVSHAHFDHLHKKSLKRVEAREGIVVPRVFNTSRAVSISVISAASSRTIQSPLACSSPPRQTSGPCSGPVTISIIESALLC